jgi:RecB family exonuclease
MTIYSHSKLKVFEECPLKYKLNYIDNIKRYEVEGIEAFLGLRVHEVLQKLYDDLKLGKVNTLKELFKYYDSIWKKNWNENIFMAKSGFSPQQYQELGRVYIKNYYDRFYPFNQDTTIETEMRLNFSLDEEGKYRFTGAIDRLSIKEEAYQAHDYKTGSSSLPTQKEVDNDRQLGLYYIAIKNKWPQIKRINLIWHYLAFNQDLTSSRTDQNLEKLKKETINLIDKIETTEEFLPKESNLCAWCEYPDLCPKKKHIFNLAPLSENEYLKEPGVKLANQYAKLKLEKLEISKKHAQELENIEEELEKIEEAIFKYAARKQLDTISGSNCLVKVRTDTKISFPGKNAKLRPQLELVIKQAKMWEEVSTLDTFALEKIIKEKAWSQRLIEQIMGYGQIKEVKKITLSKRDELER